MKIYKQKRTKLEKKAAKLISKAIKKLSKKQESIVLAIPGGSSVSGIFSLLLKQRVSWNKVHIFLLDERKVPISNKDSNFKLAYDTFLRELVDSSKIPAENIHPYISNEPLSNYNKILRNHGFSFDIVLASSGPDGHIASLFPQSKDLKNKSLFYIPIKNAPKKPKSRISASPKLIKSAKYAFLLFFGNAKEQAFINFKNKKTKISECPSKILEKTEKLFVFKSKD